MAVKSAPKCPRCGSEDTRYTIEVTHGGSNYYMFTVEERLATYERRKRTRPECSERPCYRGKFCDDIGRWPEWSEYHCDSCRRAFCSYDKYEGAKQAIQHLKFSLANPHQLNADSEVRSWR